jgi:hypothetical protein
VSADFCTVADSAILAGLPLLTSAEPKQKSALAITGSAGRLGVRGSGLLGRLLTAASNPSSSAPRAAGSAQPALTGLSVRHTKAKHGLAADTDSRQRASQDYPVGVIGHEHRLYGTVGSGERHFRDVVWNEALNDHGRAR